MRFPKKLILLAFLILSGISVFGQKPRTHNGGKSTYTRERYNVNATRVRGHKAKIVCPIFESSKFPYHGIGIKLGDPFAVTYKFYPDKNWGIAIDAGKASSGLYNRYYIQKFEEYAESGDTISYLSHRVNGDFVGEIKLLYHFDATKISP